MTAVQNRYSMMARWYEELFPVLEELHIGYVAFSPLANGFLSAKYGKDAKFDGVYDYRSMMPQFTSEAVDKNKELLTLLHRMAEEKESTPAQISPCVDFMQKAISGADTGQQERRTAEGKCRSSRYHFDSQ